MRLLASLEAMAEVGLQPDGSICRRGFTAEDRQGRERLSEWMIDAGLSLHIDAAGNLIGRLEGSDPSLPALVTGSHLDTVPTGGATTAPLASWQAWKWFARFRTPRSSSATPSS